MSHDNNLGKGILIGFFTGGILGATIALLLAPKSGKELRSDIWNKAEELGQEAEDYLNEAKEKASNLVNEGKKKTEQMVSETKTKVDELMKDAEKLFKEVKNKTS